MRILRCAVFGIVCIVLVEVIVGRTELPGRLVPRGDLGTILLLEDTVVTPHPDAAVLVFGTSRARGAFLPTVMERELGLPRGAVLNLALGGDNVFDAAMLYRRWRGRLTRPRVVVLQVDGFQFNAGRGPSERFRRYAGLRERIASYGGAARVRLLADWAFRTGAVTATLGYYAREWVTRRAAPPAAGLDRYGRLALVKLADDHEPAEFTPERLGWWLDWQYRRWRPSPGLEASARALIAAARQDGAEVYLVRLPTSSAYDSLLARYPGDPSGTFRAWLARTAGQEHAGLGIWRRPTDAGLTDRGFRDWGHLNTGGAAAWSAYFARWLKAREPALFPATAPGAADGS